MSEIRDLQYFKNEFWKKQRERFLSKEDAVNGIILGQDWSLVSSTTANSPITLPSLDTFDEIYIEMFHSEGTIMHQEEFKKESLLFESTNTTYREIVLDGIHDAQTYVTYDIENNTITPSYIEGNEIDETSSNVYTAVYIKTTNTVEGTIPSKRVIYDDSVSSLGVDNMQDAIEKLNENIDKIPTVYEYAKENGYEGTEAEFNSTLSEIDNIGVKDLETTTTITTTTVLKDEWEAMNGLNTSYSYHGVTYGDGKYVCVGDDGLSYYSTDGITWTTMTGLVVRQYQAVTYGNGRFVCVGYYGDSAYSTDGQTWQAMSGLRNDSHYHGVTYGNGRFVCVGNSGYSYYSTDGVTWTAMSGLDSVQHRAVAYGNGRFVCVGIEGKSYYSTDGLTWQAMTGLDTNSGYRGVAYGDGKFVCVGGNGKSHYSTDGLTWQAMTGLDSKSYLGVAYGDGNGRFVCVGTEGKSYYSTDGLTWQAMTGLESKSYLGVAYGTEFVCVGNNGSSYHYVYETETKTDNLHSTLQVAGTLLLTKLYTGETTVTITDDAITQDSTFDIYTDKYGVNPKNVTVNTGSITLEFKTQETDVNVKVVCK